MVYNKVDYRLNIKALVGDYKVKADKFNDYCCRNLTEVICNDKQCVNRVAIGIYK